MSSVTIPPEIEYPESDGKPMGETELHRDWTIRLLDILRHRYRDQQVYVASDLLLYYEEGTPAKFVVPDCFVVLNCAKHRRRTFQTWREGRVPDVVVEITSRSTSSIDMIDKLKVYELIGVQEYFLYDPTDEYLESPFQGFRFVNGNFHEIPATNGCLRSLSLGVDWSLRDRDLVITDVETGVEQVTSAEFAELERLRERAEKLRERAEKLQEREEKERERTAREVAENRNRELEEELRRLKAERDDQA